MAKISPRESVLLLLLLVALAPGCATSGGRRAVGSSWQADSSAVNLAELKARVARLDQSIRELDALVRGVHAGLSAQLDDALADLSALNAKVAAQDQLLRRTGMPEAGSAGPVSTEFPQSFIQPGAPIAVLDGERSDLPLTGPTVPFAADSLAPGAPVMRPLLPAAQRELGVPHAAEPFVPDTLPEVGAPVRGDATVTGVGDQGAVSAPSEEAQRLYDIAYRDLMRENFQLALLNFRSFLERYPLTLLSDNAQYWIGEVYYAQGQFDLAVEEFRKVMEEYAGQDKVPAACFKIALCFQQQQDRETARRYLEYLLENFPGTREARLAEERLASY